MLRTRRCRRAAPRARALTLLPVLFLAAACAAGDPLTGEQRAAIEQVRGFVHRLDPHSGLRAADEALRAVGSTPELEAWRLLAAARADAPFDAESEARALVAADAANHWAWFALVGTLMDERERQSEALEASERAIELAPEDPDIVWLHAQALIAAADHDGALELLAAHAEAGDTADRAAGAAALVHQRSRALYYLAYGGRGVDPERLEESRASAERARTLDPSYAAAWFGEGTVWFARREMAQALEPLERAATLSPGSITIHQRLGQTIAALQDLTDEEREARMGAQIDTLLAAHPDDPAALGAAANLWKSIGITERQEAIEARLLAEYPDSLAAEWLAVGHYREVGQEITAAAREGREPDPAVRAEYEDLLRAFAQRPRHNHLGLKGDAFRSLHGLIDDESQPDDVRWIVEGMVEFEGINPHIAFAGGAITLAEHTEFYDRAEEIARIGIEEGRRKVESQRARYENEGEYQRAQQYFEGIMYDALGWVLFKAGRLEEAEAELLRAYDSDPKNRGTLHHLGRFYEAHGDIAEAERFYIQGVAAQAPGENPNRAALEDLYVERTGGRDGFEAYLADVETRDARERHAAILADRIAEPSPVEPFELATLDGDTVSSDDLRGAITVINFWGIWCGWCVIEMPELQQLHERYADDPDVRILTINNDPDPGDVPPWMQEKGYDLEVLLDEGYVTATAGVAVFPTTWFLDREGRLTFVKTGWSQELLEEFSWRIEALR